MERKPNRNLNPKHALVIIGLATGKPWAEALQDAGLSRGSESAVRRSIEKRMGNIKEILRHHGVHEHALAGTLHHIIEARPDQDKIRASEQVMATRLAGELMGEINSRGHIATTQPLAIQINIVSSDRRQSASDGVDTIQTPMVSVVRSDNEPETQR